MYFVLFARGTFRKREGVFCYSVGQSDGSLASFASSLLLLFFFLPYHLHELFLEGRIIAVVVFVVAAAEGICGERLRGCCFGRRDHREDAFDALFDQEVKLL